MRLLPRQYRQARAPIPRHSKQFGFLFEPKQTGHAVCMPFVQNEHFFSPQNIPPLPLHFWHLCSCFPEPLQRSQLQSHASAPLPPRHRPHKYSVGVRDEMRIVTESPAITLCYCYYQFIADPPHHKFRNGLGFQKHVLGYACRPAIRQQATLPLPVTTTSRS
jgi:hypothetical protein